MLIATRIILVLALLSSISSVVAIEINVIKNADQNMSGVGKFQFPSDTTFQSLPFGALSSYEGEWKQGYADGEGKLIFSFLGQVGYGYYSSPSDSQLYFLGSFKNGSPSGNGKIVYSNNLVTQEIIGHFTSNGETPQTSIYRVGNQEKVVFTSLGKNRDVNLIRAMQYASYNAVLPSRMFFGERDKNGSISGEWIDLPWYEERATDNLIVGFGKDTEENIKGDIINCAFDARPIWANPEMDKYTMPQIGGVGSYLFPRSDLLDKQYLLNSKCEEKTKTGWSFVFKIDRSHGIFWNVKYESCITPSGKVGALKENYCYEHKKKKKKHDVFTNLAQEAKRFVDRRVIGNIDKVGGAIEKSMCRATGTEPGKNCNINASIGYTWPVGNDTSKILPPAEEYARQKFIESTQRATALKAVLNNSAASELLIATAELNAICISLCRTLGQQKYSSMLLKEIEFLANAEMDDEGLIRSIASLNRETASVLSAGVKITIAAAAVAGTSFGFYNFGASVDRTGKILDAIDQVQAWQSNSHTFERLDMQQKALRTLHNLYFAQLNAVAANGKNLLADSLLVRIPILKALSPQRANLLSVAIALHKTKREVDDFVEKYKNVKSENELYDAIISETLKPLGLELSPVSAPPHG